MILCTALAALGQPAERVIIADFDDGRVDPQTWALIPRQDIEWAFVPRNGGQALHLRAAKGNAGIATRERFPARFRLTFDFLQPADEAGGYRAVVAHASGWGHSFWFEYDRSSLAVWTNFEGGWAPRWTAEGMQPDTWYTVTVDNELERVRFRIQQTGGAVVAESPWLPHDVVGAGSLSLRADSGDTLRGVLYDSIVLELPGRLDVGQMPGVERALHDSLAAAGPIETARIRSLETADGLAVQLDAAAVVRGWALDGRPLEVGQADVCAGIWAWDVAAGRQYHRFLPRPDSDPADTLRLACEPLRLELDLDAAARADRLDFAGDLRDTSGADRAIVLVWVLPLDATGWTWGDDLLRSREVSAEGSYHNAERYPESGHFGSHLVSPYPWACLTRAQGGLMVARPLDTPRLMGFFYDQTLARRFLAIRVELGLSPLTLKFPSRASFRFCLSRVPQPEWGFRAATQRYYELYPDFFRKRVEREGIWHLWVSPQVARPEDFALVFHEQEPYSEDRVLFDDAHGGYSFTYAEPCALWQRTGAWDSEGRFDPAAFLQEVARRATQPADARTDYPFWTQPQGVPDAEIARALQHSFLGTEDAPCVAVAPPDRVMVMCNGDPELPHPSRASLWFEYEGVPALNDPRVDGAYLDSVGWSGGGPDLGENFRTAQWATADIPLIPSFRHGRPCQLAAFAHYELYEGIAEAMHSRGKLTLANTFPFAHSFTAHLLDVMGVGESNDLHHFHDPVQLSFCRALAYHKPLSHMNYAYLLPTVPLPEKERAMHRNLIYGVWPGTGNGGNLEHLEAVRPLYRRYMPIFWALAAAGWEPVTLARVQPAGLIVERYGVPPGRLYLAVHNPDDTPATAQVTLDPALRTPALPPQATDLVTGAPYPVDAGRITLPLEPAQTAVLSLGG